MTTHTRNNVFLILLQGLSGSGKTTAGRLLADTFGGSLLRTDVIRKQLFGLSPRDSSEDAGMDIYTPNANRQTYLQIKSDAEALLKQGVSVIIDGAFLQRTERTQCIEIAKALNTPFLIVKCMAPDNILEARIIIRQSDNTDASEATPELIHQQKKWEEPLSIGENKHSILINTHDPDWKRALILQIKEFLF